VKIRPALALALILATAAIAAEQRPTLSNAVRAFVSVDEPVIALVHARVIDGTGAPVRTNQTILIRNGAIEAIGNDAGVPADARVIDLSGKTVIPGLVMVHEHLYYPTGPVRAYLAESFTRLYLAGGVTSLRTAGNNFGYGDFNITRDINKGLKPGPWIDATAPYLDGPGAPPQVHELRDAADAESMVNFWADAGATSFKAYINITRAELGAAINAAHKRGLKITGHLCSVTLREAAELGIDNLEHAFWVSTDFVPDKKPDICPGQQVGWAAVADQDLASAPVQSLISFLVQKKVALTSTLTVEESLAYNRPKPPGLDVLVPSLKEDYERRYATLAGPGTNVPTRLLPKEMALEVAFVRAGGLLLAGTDPTANGGIVAGYSNQREVELLVEAGFTPLEAIRIATLNGATYLGRADRVGSIVRGKQADLVVIAGDPSAHQRHSECGVGVQTGRGLRP